MEKQQLIHDLDDFKEQYNIYREREEWDEAQAAAMCIMNICRRLEFLKIQEAVCYSLNFKNTCRNCSAKSTRHNL